MDDYSDIINLSRPVSKRPRMTLEQRSAQFAPFAALTGYEGQVKETARLTNKKIEINEELKEILNKKIQLIQKKIKEQPQIEITYFIPDSKKDGGKYETVTNSKFGNQELQWDSPFGRGFPIVWCRQKRLVLTVKIGFYPTQ